MEILPPDNGERFFSEYLFQQLARQNDGVEYGKNTNRCLCKDCGGKNRNPYQKNVRKQVVHSSPPTEEDRPSPPNQRYVQRILPDPAPQVPPRHASIMPWDPIRPPAPFVLGRQIRGAYTAALDEK